MFSNITFAIISVILAGLLFLFAAIIYEKNTPAALMLGLVGLLATGGAVYFYQKKNSEMANIIVLPSTENKIDSFQSNEKRYQADDSNDGTVKRWWRNL